VENATLKVRFM